MAYTDDFTAWWSAYPRKVGKRVAFQKWKTAIAEITDDRSLSRKDAIAWLLERTKQFANSEKGNSGEFCPYPSTWLYQGRYDDDIDEWGGKQQAYEMPTQEDVRKWRP